MRRPRLFRPPDAEIRRERVKLFCTALNAIGVAILIGSAVAPLVDPTRQTEPLRFATGVALGIGFVLAALWLLRYIKREEAG